MDPQFHIDKRQAFIDQMQENSVAVFFSGKAPRKSADSFYPFEVDKNFYYLSGIPREDMVLLLSKVAGKITQVLYIPPVKEVYEKWIGLLMRDSEAEALSGIKDIRDRRDFELELFDGLSNAGTRPDAVYLYFFMSRFNEPLSVEQSLAQKIQTQFPGLEIINAYEIMAEMRCVKTSGEVDNIRRAIAVTETAFHNVLDNLKPGMYEYQARAHFEEVLLHQALLGAFEVIPASEKNATILHYLDGTRKMEAGELLLMDAGVKVDQYCSDITRTFPVGGRFTPRQKDIYRIVLASQQVALDLMKPGAVMIEVNQQVIDFFARELKTIGLINEEDEVKKYYYHGIGHPLGLDVHDLRLRNVILKEGMVFTVEPGLYIAEECLGIRIEDNVLVTAEGVEVLSPGIIKDIDAIEQRMAR